MISILTKIFPGIAVSFVFAGAALAQSPDLPDASPPVTEKIESTPEPLNCVGFDWTKSKYRYQKFFWPIGYAAIPPTGPGYYSLRDWVCGEYRETPPKSGYPRALATPQGFGDVDFSYVDDPKYHPTIMERIHRIHLNDNWMLGTGGEYRNRYNYEGNSRLTGKVNEYDLNRLRIFGDLWYQDKFRVFAEFIDVRTTTQSLAPGLGDRNHGDFLNLFVDVKTFMLGDEAVYTRLGRQQLLLGSQRIISPGDWGFAARTFDGVRMTRRSDKFDIDLFWLRPVIPNADRLDSSNDRQNFAGVYTTYRPAKDQILDLYWLYLSDHDNPATAKQTPVGPLTNITPYDVHTLGFRYAGKAASGFLWDSENMMQLGSHNHRSIFAGNLSNGIGYNFGKLPMNPTVWAYFDYASGSSNLGGTHTFNQLYPLGHYYLGQIDYIGRANIEDLNFHLYLYPTKWITFNTQYHIFHLAQANDALYNTAGNITRSDPTGKAGRDVGSEIDVSANFHIGPHTDILAVYTHFFAGSFLNATGPSSDANTVYLVFNFRW